MILTQRFAKVLLPASILLTGLVVMPSIQAQSAQESKPYWEYVRTESGVVPYASNGCYQPTVHRSKEGLVEITVTHCGNPPEAQTTLRMEWTKPPRILYPNQPFDFQVKTTLIGNLNPNWVLNGSIYMRPEVVSDKVPFGGGVGAEVRKGTPQVVIWDNLRRTANEQQKAPPEWWATNTKPNSMIRLSFVSVFSNEHWWTYIYRYVDPAQSGSGNAEAGYQLYFDGKLVSGPDAATYTREQAEQNCRWNMQNNSNLAIRCAYNGAIFAEQNRSSDDRPSSSKQIAKIWNVVETDLRSSQYWKATWNIKGDGRSFDGHWKVFPGGQEGDLPNFARIRTILNNQIIIDRPGLGTYQGTISSDRRSIRGTQSWCSTCSWEAKYDLPLPQELR